MDDFLGEFLTETAESLDVIDVELVKFEQDPNNAQILDNIFRLVHTIKGTCGFLGLPRLEALAHAAETLMGKYRDGQRVTPEGVTLILVTLDTIKAILGQLAETGQEAEGSDDDLIAQLEVMAGYGPQGGHAEPLVEIIAMDEPEPAVTEGNLTFQVLERDLRPGEVSLDDLERAFREAPGPELAEKPQAVIAPVAVAAPQPKAEAPHVATQAAPQPVDAKKPAARAPREEAADDDNTAGKDGARTTQTIRVNVDTLEQLMTMVSELVLVRNQLLEMVRRLDDSEFKVPLQRLSNVTAELQEGVMKTRMQPIGNAWQKLPRIVRDLSMELGKKIELDMRGAETELDRQVLELIKDPLTHMVRNSADHGLEDPAGRVAAGKKDAGKITLNAFHEGGHIIIEIADDGRGLNTDKIRAKVIANGLASEADAEKMTEAQIHKFIFHAGLSTAEKVTNVSGRGVGMDVVRTNIELIGGTVDVRSVKGRGTTFTIKIPLTLAIVSALIVESVGQRFAIPQLSVIELVRAHNNAEHRLEMINDTPVLRLRDQLLPVIYLSRILGIEANRKPDATGKSKRENAFVVVTQVGAQTFGIVVDGVFHTEEIVVKPMASLLRDITMFSGNTILGDGSVIMIIDPNGVSQVVANEIGAPAERNRDAETVVDLSVTEKVAMLVFRAASKDLKAVPLSLVTRLEEIKVETIERSDGRDLVQYRGTLMPLIYVDEHRQRRSEGNQPILVFADGDRTMGLVVDEIVDIVEDRLKVEIASDEPGVIGTAVVRGKATEIMDVGYYIPKAFDDWQEPRASTGLAKAARKVLLVDDSAFFRNMLAPLLAASGYQVTAVGSARQALSMKDNGASFDVIVSDIEMPEMDGIAFAHALRSDPNWRGTPIIALSSHTTPEVIERSREAGFEDYIAKFDREGLLQTLKELRNRKGQAA